MSEGERMAKTTTSRKASRKLGSRNTRNKSKVAAQELPVPDVASIYNVIDFEKMERTMEKIMAREFYSELEVGMNELAEQKKRMKQIISSYLGDSKVPHTPKKNPPGALAWRQIGAHKALNFDSDDDVTADGEASMLQDPPELRGVSPILPTRRMLGLDQNRVPTPTRSGDLFGPESPQLQTAKLRTPIRVTPKLCDLPRPAEVPMPKPRQIPRTVPTPLKKKSLEMAMPVVDIEPIDPQLMQLANDQKRDNDTVSIMSGSMTSLPTVSTNAGPSRIPRSVTKPHLKNSFNEEDKFDKVKKIEEKLNMAEINHQEFLKEKAERARREREERARRVEMNNRKKQQQEQERLQDTKAREQKLKEFQAMQQSTTPSKYGLRSNAPTSAVKTPSRLLTPGRQAIPVKKTKQEMQSPFTFPSQSPAPATTSTNAKRKQPKPNAQEKAARKEAKKASVPKKTSVESKRQLEIQKALEVERLRQEQEERERLRREQKEREAELIRLEEERGREAEARRLEEERQLLRAREEAEQRMLEEQQNAHNELPPEESMIVESDERVVSPEEHDADVENAQELTERILELSMVEPDETMDDESKENTAPPNNLTKTLLPPSANKTFDKVKATTQTSYDITPAKVFLPSTEQNYNVDDLSSNDSTDDEENPRKIIPQWARSANLVPYVKRIDKEISSDARAHHFGLIQAPIITELFPTKKKYPPRTSSAVWTSPLQNPTPGYSRLHQILNTSSK